MPPQCNRAVASGGRLTDEAGKPKLPHGSINLKEVYMTRNGNVVQIIFTMVIIGLVVRYIRRILK